MVELALHYGGGPLLMRAIAEKHGISRKYLHALLTSLKSASLVRSVRGSGGGYVLARAPAAIKISDVVRVLEGTLAPSECVEDPGVCKHSGGCVAHDLWHEVNELVEQVLGSVTLADLVTRQAEKNAAPTMYHI